MKKRIKIINNYYLVLFLVNKIDEANSNVGHWPNVLLMHCSSVAQSL